MRIVRNTGAEAGIPQSESYLVSASVPAWCFVRISAFFGCASYRLIPPRARELVSFWLANRDVGEQDVQTRDHLMEDPTGF